jgi:molecular chaperone GrpE
MQTGPVNASDRESQRESQHPAGGADDTGGAPSAAQLEALRASLAAAEDNARVQRDLYLRAVAELENVRKRAQRDIENAHRYALEGFVSELLNVRDSLELGVRSGAQADAKALLAGQQATLKLLERAFDKYSIKRLDPTGQRFDPSQHEAVLVQQSRDAEPDSVLQVVQSGYELNGRLLRPARVVVAKAAEEADGEG